MLALITGRNGPRSPVWLLLVLALAGCEDDPAGPSGQGLLRVDVATQGVALDQDGYAVSLDGTSELEVDVNSSTVFARVTEGDHQVALTDVAENCVIGGDNPRTVVVSDGLGETLFQVNCTFPTGSALVFQSDREGDNEIYRIRADGTGLTRLTNDTANDIQPEMSPDGTKIVFSSDRDTGGTTGDIFVMNADGGGLANLTDGAGNNSDPSWSPDGSRIAFARVEGGNRDIWVMDADGANRQRLTTDGASDSQPAWSPDGTKIAFASERDGKLEVYVMAADGSNPVNLTNRPGIDAKPAWSRDGTRIAFTTDRDGNFEIYTMGPDGSNPVNLTNAPGSSEGEAAWSFDGRLVAFVTTRTGNDDIFVMQADGSNPTRVTVSPDRDLEPAWNPL